jgi:N-methylhydantoinase A
MSFAGPAIVETAGTTIVAHPGNLVRVDPYGNLIITVEDDER